MIAVSTALVFATALLVVAALVAGVGAAIPRRARSHGSRNEVREQILVGAPAPHDEALGQVLAPTPEADRTDSRAREVGVLLGRIALVVLTIALVIRTVVVGHPAFANQYEFAVSFAWGVLLAHVVAEYRFRLRALTLGVLPVALVLLLYAVAIGGEPSTLVPALRHRWLLTVHVFTAILAYGAAAVAFGAALLTLLRGRIPRIHSGPERLDDIAYRAVAVAYPLLTLMIGLGAVWAEIAWGTYWSWDPKETSALVTWLVYGAYLHARVVRDWRGNRAAWLLVVGFACVVFTYAGNLFFGGLHSYA
jgi:ABC-type transport system involved in cytochrome c biogenesis permease subunit